MPATLLVLVTACSGDDDRAAPAPDPIDWRDCEDDSLTSVGLDCGTLDVPLDYDDPGADTIELALVRLPATSSSPTGSILFNPGGPGGSGIEFVATAVVVDPSVFGPIHRSFDLIGFDPRGVGDSSPIDCVDDAYFDEVLLADPTPDDDAERALRDAASDEFVDGCLADKGDTLAEYDTVNTARDMDQIRRAVGDEQLTYYGVSYGSYLGAAYATLFPDNVRALVLDGAFSPGDDDAITSAEIQLRGFEQAFGNWAADCEADDTCPFHADDVSARWLALRDALDADPLPIEDGRTAGEGAILWGTIAALYSPSTWTALSQALAAAEGGDGSKLVGLADLYTGRDPDGHYSNQEEANPVISCASGLNAAMPEDAAERLAALVPELPHFAALVDPEDLDDPCTGLPVGSTPAFAYDGDAPSLVIGGQNDPATPFVYAERLVDAMGASAGLVTFTGEGHGATGSSACVTELVGQVLVDAETPPADTTCDPDPERQPPAWFSTLPAVDGLAPYDLGDVGELFGFPSSFYATALVSEDGAAEVVAAIEAAYQAAGWPLVDNSEVPVGDSSIASLTFAGTDGILAALVIGTEALVEPDLASLGTLFPDDHTIVVLTAPT
ncbi:MAG: alpha/beta fold hydrolase [Ilumatobacteraceae bacterium]